MIHEVIDKVRVHRNTKIRAFIEKEVARLYFQDRYGVALSDRKFEFLSRDLAELMIAPVDLAHYAAIITEYKESLDKPGLDEHCDELVDAELSRIFQKYIF